MALDRSTTIARRILKDHTPFRPFNEYETGVLCRWDDEAWPCDPIELAALVAGVDIPEVTADAELD